MAKKALTFQDKLRKASEKVEYVKVVKAYKADDGSWKFRTKMVQVTDDNRSKLYV
ncbi:MAG: hypothetical protein V3T31_07980 [candidate division Zixibacteria bacterium]